MFWGLKREVEDYTNNMVPQHDAGRMGSQNQPGNRRGRRSQPEKISSENLILSQMAKAFLTN